MSTLMPDPPSALKSTQDLVPLAERDDIRRSIPMTELVLVDPYEAQGWRVRADERLDRLFEARCDWVRAYGRAGQLAIDTDGLSLTYDELDARANQLARFLRLRGANAGDRIGLLFDRPADGHVAMLAVLKVGATYVPMDAGAPAQHLAAIVEDARVRTVLSMSGVRVERITARGVEVVHLDRAAPLIAEQSTRRLVDAERGSAGDRFASIAYRIDADGRPTGMAVEHRSICNVVKVAAEVYGIRPSDRVYQGAPTTSALSVEETWVPWAVGATLVPRPAGVLTGRDLHALLDERRVTALFGAPSLLATLERELPDLRILLVAGPVCPPALVRRWHRPSRRFLKVYGPAEATVSATWTELHPDRPATLGIPLPTFSTVVLDVDDPFHALPHGQVGEIGIAGIGLACGYLNRDDLTEKAFIPDFLGIPSNPSGRIFRTGDLGRVNAGGEIEYHGRIGGPGATDELGELDEIEPVLRPVPEVPAPRATEATAHEPVTETLPIAGEPATIALPVVVEPSAAMTTERPVSPELPVPVAIEAPAPAPVPVPVPLSMDLPVPVAVEEPAPLAAEPGTMQVELPRPAAVELPVPVAVEAPAPMAMVLPVPVAVDAPAPVAVELPVPVPVELPVPVALALPVPVAVALPVPVEPSAPQAAEPMQVVDLAEPPAPPAGIGSPEVERELAALLAEVIGAGTVAVDAHFFDDLGADSMLMARFCAKVRGREDLPTVAIKDVYQHSSIQALTAVLAPMIPSVVPAGPPEPAMVNTSVMRAVQLVRTVRGARHRVTPDRTPRYVLCGALQLLFMLGYPSLTAVAGVMGFDWVTDGAGPLEVYLRSVVFGSAMFVALCALPVLLKWVLVGRWKPQEIRVWSMAYFRFWVVRTLVQRNPMALFVGSPLYVLYLRALGAKIGRGAVILSKNVPVCTDLLTVGEGAVVRKDSFFTGYRAHDGVIQTGAVSIGRDALVGEVTVLDVWTSVGDGAQLGHSSSLHAGQSVPRGEHWHGSPAQPTDVDYRQVPTTRVSSWRRFVFATVQLVNLLLLGSPLALGVLTFAVSEVPQLEILLEPATMHVTSWTFYRDMLVLTAVLYFGAIAVGLVFVGVVPRLLNLFITPDKVYPLYGFHYWVQRAIARTTNRKAFNRIFGDSSFIVGYLRWLGYDLGDVEQTGSNFGEDVKHDSPFLTSVGRGTVVADGLSAINADFSSTSFRLSRVSIGAHNFLGNRIAYPAQGRTGDDCLLATKLMVPVDGDVRSGVGLLGAPSFEIPRTVERDKQLGLGSADELHDRLESKNRHNADTIVFHLVSRWIFYYTVAVLYLGALDVTAVLGPLAVALGTVGVFFVGLGYLLLVDRLFRHLAALRPDGCSIYDRAFWRHERFWKVCGVTYINAFNGTPLKNVIWRLLGVRIGRRVFDDGLLMTERVFTTIGDGCTFNAGSTIQCHSQEDGGFKSDRTVIGSGATIGVGGFVHYGVTIGDRAVLAADSFLMKGEDMPPNALWGGNPAKKMLEHSGDLQVRKVSIAAGSAAVLVRH